MDVGDGGSVFGRAAELSEEANPGVDREKECVSGIERTDEEAQGLCSIVGDDDCNVNMNGNPAGSPSCSGRVSDGNLISDNVFVPRRSPRLLGRSPGQKSPFRKDSEDVGKEEESKVGMVFNSELEVEAFYKNYAKRMGFGVTRAHGSYSGKKERRATTWRCEYYGDPVLKSNRKSGSQQLV